MPLIEERFRSMQRLCVFNGRHYRKKYVSDYFLKGNTEFLPLSFFRTWHCSSMNTSQRVLISVNNEVDYKRSHFEKIVELTRSYMFPLILKKIEISCVLFDFSHSVFSHVLLVNHLLQFI